MSDLSDLRAVQRAAFRAWLLAVRPSGPFDAISIAGQYRHATGEPIDWHETAAVLDLLDQDDELSRCGHTRSGFVTYTF